MAKRMASWLSHDTNIAAREQGQDAPRLGRLGQVLVDPGLARGLLGVCAADFF
jgi:hypothetical protein